MSQLLLLLSIFLIYTNSFKIQDNHHAEEIEFILQSQESCNITNFDFMNLDYLSSRNPWMSDSLKDYQGYSFSKINDTFYKTNENISYEIEKVKMTLKWIPDNQTASFGQNQIIMFDGGKVQATFNFMWVSADKSSGTVQLRGGEATAKVVSKELPWAISVMQHNLYGEKWTGLGLLDIGNITLNGFNITDIDCNYFNPSCEVTDSDFSVLKFMMEKAPSIQTVKMQMETVFNPNFKNILNRTICCSKTSLNYPIMSYQWKGYTKTQSEDGMNLTIKRISTNIMIEKTGLKPGVIFTSQIRPIPDSKCGQIPTTGAYSYGLFGTGQEYISFTVFQNLLREGIRQTQLNTRLNRDFWATKNFKYTVDYLSDILSRVQDKFPYYAIINGSCEVDPDNWRIYKEAPTGVNVQIKTKCHLNVSQTKLIEFTINLTLMVQPKFLENTFDVQLNSYGFNVTYNDSFGFKLLDLDSANQIVKQSLDRLFENKLFGSGWNYLLGQKKPKIFVKNQTIIIYDETSIPKINE